MVPPNNLVAHWSAIYDWESSPRICAHWSTDARGGWIGRELKRGKGRWGGAAEELAGKEVKKTAEKVISDLLMWHVISHLNWPLFSLNTNQCCLHLYTVTCICRLFAFEDWGAWEESLKGKIYHMLNEEEDPQIQEGMQWVCSGFHLPRLRV